MNRRTPIVHAALPAVLLLALAACEAKKSSNPLSPTVAGPIAGVEITAPRLLEPQQGFRFRESQLPVKLVIENSTTTGVRPISYAFEIATDSAFNAKVFTRTGVQPGDGRTTVQVDSLELGRPYYWRARAEDGANSSTFATAAFEVLPKAVLNAPAPIRPVNNDAVGERRPALRIANSQRNSAVGQVTYFFVVARDQAFTQIVAYEEIGEGGGETAWTVNRDLEFSVTHFWRVRATDGETYSDWSATQAFRTPGAPAPVPLPGPGPAPGGPCISSSPEAIVACERSKFGHMSHGQMYQMMRAVAQSLNRNNIGGGPYGILRKQSGTNCNGYSCDVICAGQGNSQRQWDVLGDIDDDQTPRWGGPNRVPDIRVDLCEIQ